MNHYSMEFKYTTTDMTICTCVAHFITAMKAKHTDIPDIGKEQRGLITSAKSVSGPGLRPLPLFTLNSRHASMDQVMSFYFVADVQSPP